MWYINKFLARTRISLILLLLISVRLIPFNLLHYHQNQFAGLQTLRGNVGIQSDAKAIYKDIPTCSFDQFLSLTSTGFVLGSCPDFIVSASTEIGKTIILELRAKQLLHEILNKGSPLLV